MMLSTILLVHTYCALKLQPKPTSLGAEMDAAAIPLVAPTENPAILLNASLVEVLAGQTTRSRHRHGHQKMRLTTGRKNLLKNKKAGRKTLLKNKKAGRKNLLKNKKAGRKNLLTSKKERRHKEGKSTDRFHSEMAKRRLKTLKKAVGASGRKLQKLERQADMEKAAVSVGGQTAVLGRKSKHEARRASRDFKKEMHKKHASRKGKSVSKKALLHGSPRATGVKALYARKKPLFALHGT